MSDTNEYGSVSLGRDGTTLKYSISLDIPPRYTWTPQRDITAYELALCIGPLMAHNGYAIRALPDEARRHFREVK